MIKVNKIKPMFNGIVTTMDIYEDFGKTQSGLIDASKKQGSVKEYQKVVSVGSSVRDIKVGDLVSINPTRFMVTKHKEGSLQNGIVKDNMTIDYKFDIITMNGIDHLLLQDRDVDFIIEEYEELPDEAPKEPSKIITQSIIL